MALPASQEVEMSGLAADVEAQIFADEVLARRLQVVIVIFVYGLGCRDK